MQRSGTLACNPGLNRFPFFAVSLTVDSVEGSRPMSRHSSGPILRAVVIFAVLAALPMLALGSAVMPASIRDWFSRYWPAVKPASAPAPLSAPQFEPVPATAVPPLNSTAPWQSGGENAYPADPRVGPPGLIARDNATHGRPPAASAWGAEVPEAAMRRPDDRGTAVMPVSYQSVPGEFPGAAAAIAAPGRYDSPMPVAEMPAAVASAATGQLNAEASGDRNQSEQMQSFQRRLHDLGATYLLLETWGDRQQLYRCFCKVAIGGNPNCTRHFEATDPDPLRALATVTEQVEQWRQGQQGPQ